MQRLAVIETRNGYLVVEGRNHLGTLQDVAEHCWSFNSRDAAMVQIQRVLESWEEAAKDGGGS